MYIFNIPLTKVSLYRVIPKLSLLIPIRYYKYGKILQQTAVKKFGEDFCNNP